MFNDLLSKEVSRREFLAYVGAGILAITGIAGMLKSLGMQSKKERGFGSGNYGGQDKKW